ncbi:MAG: ABC transporter ATP-binding protein, partial [Natrialbaceae archaeon]
GLLGPSGCGKTTLVQAVAGHVRPTAGRIRLRGRDVTDDSPESRRVGLVFQEPALFPHMTVGENVAYGLAARDDAPGERAALVDEYLELVDLDTQRAAYPRELSGGQKRRVELARALAPQPDLLLLDEPLSGLDRALREELREEIARIQRETGVATLLVTHDQETAMALSDRLAVMRAGGLAAVGDPRRLYESPPSPFVASFLGRSNSFSATVTRADPPTVALDDEEFVIESAAGFDPGSSVVCHVRPEALSLSADAGALSLRGEVVRVADLGRRYDVWVRTPAGTLLVECAATPPEAGETVSVTLDPEYLSVFLDDGSAEQPEYGLPNSR